jgi:hypothetical protein
MSRFSMLGSTLRPLRGGTGAKVLVWASKALGTTAAGGAADLNLWICYQATSPGSTIMTLGGGVLGLRVPQNTRIPFSLNSAVGGLPPGNYQFGLCGQTSAAQVASWKSNEYSYVSAAVVN